MFKGLLDFKNQSFKIKWEIITPIIFFIIIGFLVLSSTSNNEIFVFSTFYKQLIWFFLGCIVFVVIQYIKIQYLYDYSYIFFLLLILLLLITRMSPEIEGARRWVVIGPFYFQPSEFGKIIYAIALARFFSDIRAKDQLSLFFFSIVAFLMVPPMLVFLQPDLGTAMIYISIIIPVLFWSGYNSGLLFVLISPLVSLLAVWNLAAFYFWIVICLIVLIYTRQTLILSAINIFFNLMCGLLSPYIYNNVLKSHQRQRIETLFDPYSDPLETGYQVIQSLISIGSGGLWGKGLGNGTQTHLKFLPVRDTDFIISVVSEEFGFFTIMLILLSLSIFIYWCINYAAKIENKFASLLLIGSCSIIFMHYMINMSMVSGILPVTGLPVPFISYGGSFFISCSILIGIINNISNNYI